MQISRYNNVLSSYGLKPQYSIKGNDTSSSKMTKSATETTATTKSKKLTEADEMEAFKNAIHKEIGDIYGKASSALLSNSVHITDGAFERMKSDPEFKNKIMDTLRQDAKASHLLPYGVHLTTTIDENGYSAYGANVYENDSKETKDDKKAEAEKKAEGAFYRQSSAKQIIDEWLESRILQQSQEKNAFIDSNRMSEYAQTLKQGNQQIIDVSP